MHAYLGHDERRPAPLILGHEASGVILGGNRNGERVAINPLVTCRIARLVLADVKIFVQSDKLFQWLRAKALCRYGISS